MGHSGSSASCSVVSRSKRTSRRRQTRPASSRKWAGVSAAPSFGSTERTPPLNENSAFFRSPGDTGRAATQRFCSLSRSAWAREFYDTKTAAGNSHHAALRKLGNRWLEVLWHCLRLGVPYDEAIHTANRNRARQVAA